MRLSPGRLQSVLAERDAARAERDAANIALTVQLQKDTELQKRLEVLEIVQGRRPTPTKQQQQQQQQQQQSAAPLQYDVEDAATQVNDEDEETHASDAGWLCASSCVHFAESAGLVLQAFATFTKACLLAIRAVCAIGYAIQAGTDATLRTITNCFTTCRLPPPPMLPPPGDDDDDDPVNTEAPSSYTQNLIIGLSVSALVILLWDWRFGGVALAVWTPLGACAGFAGSAIGIGIAALATPTDSSLDVDELASGKVRRRIIPLPFSAVSIYTRGGGGARLDLCL